MFTFKLKAVLDYRRQIEDTCQQQFALSKQKWEAEKQKLEQFYEAWKNCLVEWRRMQQDTVSVAAVDMYQKYMLRLRHEITDQAERVKKCLEDLDQKREILMNARKEKKMLENLEESQYLLYRKELKEKEQKFMDEVATQRFNIKGQLQ